MMTVPNKPPIFKIGLLFVILGIGAFLAVMLISKSPKSSKKTAFVSGESVKGLEIEDNRSSASTFVQLKEAENISVRRNTHEPK